MLGLHYSNAVPIMKETDTMQFDIKSRDFALTDALPLGCTHAIRRMEAYSGALRIIRNFFRGRK